MVYLNLQGREPQGIVTREEAPALLARIQERFLALKDGETRAGASARVMPGLYDGPEAWGTLEYPCADLMLGLRRALPRRVDLRERQPAPRGGRRRAHRAR